MKREDIIRLAQEAGGWGDDGMNFCEFSELEKFAQLVAAAEREECARLAIHVRAKQGTWGRQLVCEDIAIAIRARK